MLSILSLSFASAVIPLCPPLQKRAVESPFYKRGKFSSPFVKGGQGDLPQSLSQRFKADAFIEDTFSRQKPASDEIESQRQGVKNHNKKSEPPAQGDSLLYLYLY
jgi:hypothetical protein